MGQLVTSFGKGFTVLEAELQKDLTGEEKVERTLHDPFCLSFTTYERTSSMPPEQELQKGPHRRREGGTILLKTFSSQPRPDITT